MSTHNKYFARLGPVLEPRYRIGQRTVVNSRAIHLNILPGYRYSVSLLAVIGKKRVFGIQDYLMFNFTPRG
jgi:hypothetical protein